MLCRSQGSPYRVGQCASQRGMRGMRAMAASQRGMRGMRAMAASHAGQDGESTCESHSY